MISPRQILNDLSRRISARWAQSDEDFTLAQALEPLFSNKGILTYILPLPVVTLANRLFPGTQGLDAIAVLLGVWYVGGFLIAAGLAVRWRLRAEGTRLQAEQSTSARDRLGQALANVHRGNASYFTIIRWEESARISKKGVVNLRRVVSIEPGQQMDVFWSDLESYGPRVPQSDVKVRVRERIPDGGTRAVPFDELWTDRPDSTLCSLYVHFDRPLAPGRSRELILTWSWPSFYDKLWKDETPELMRYKLSRPCRELIIRMRFPRRRNRQLTVTDVAGFDQSVERTSQYEIITLRASEQIDTGDEVVATITPSRMRKGRE